MSANGTRIPSRGFTLVELLVSMLVLTLMLLVLVQMTNSTQKIWTSTTGKVEQFRDAREGFETITRQLSQATLNTYWDYQTNTGSNSLDGSNSLKAYTRQSELRFLSGPAVAGDLASNPPRPTHAIFFQAPLGYVANTTYQNLENSLNTTGYFIEFASDVDSRPGFYNQLNKPQRYRFRLMEMVEPSDELTLYTSTAANAASADRLKWFTTPLGSAALRRTVAENIVALIILPKLSQGDKSASGNAYNSSALSPRYAYDSTIAGEAASNNDPGLNSKNQLPPVVQVTMVAVDEASFNRYLPATSSNSVPVPTDLYTGSNGSLFTDATKYDADIQTFQAVLQSKKLNYRVFSSNVSLKAAKWSRAQTN